MKFNKSDLVRPENVVAIGKRSNVYLSGNKTWEVYARLSNRSEFLFGIKGLESEASALLLAVLRYASLAGQAFTETTEGDYVNVFCIVRYYVDGEPGDFVALIEDESGASWPILTGTHAQCTQAIHDLSAQVAMLEDTL